MALALVQQTQDWEKKKKGKKSSVPWERWMLTRVQIMEYQWFLRLLDEASMGAGDHPSRSGPASEA